jgi:hypothetical protein
MSGADQILSTKPVMLSAPGFAYNDLYYSTYNSSLSLLEATANWQNVISLSSLTFGGSSQLLLPTDQFVQHAVLRLRLDNLNANVVVPRGWGYAMLNSISYILGSSSSTSIVLNTDSILQTVLAQCKTAELRDEILRLGGEEQKGPLVAPSGEAVPYLEAFVLLPMPFSSLCSETLPIDTTMLSNNIAINIIFNTADAIFGGSGTKPAAFLAAELMLHQIKLSDQSASLRRDMINKPGLVYSYPFIHHQSFSSPSFTGVRTSDPGTPCSVQLNQFANADLTGITLWVVSDADKFPGSSNTPNPWNCDNISNILVQFNGSTLFRMNGSAFKLCQMLSAPYGAGYFENSVVAAGTTAPFTSTPKNCYPVYLDFARLRASCIEAEHMFNTIRFPNQNLIITFNTQFGSGVTYRLYATYHYNAIAAFADGVSSIMIA